MVRPNGALVIKKVDGTVFGGLDPAPGKVKSLQVQAAYGWRILANDAMQTCPIPVCKHAPYQCISLPVAN